jgi:hypothetical protein
MAKSKDRTIRFDQFKKQLADVDVDALQRVELSRDSEIFIRLGVNLGGDDDEFREFMAGVEASDDPEEICMIILGFHEGTSAEEQWKKFEDAGGKAHELVALWGTATAARREELGKLRPRRY